MPELKVFALRKLDLIVDEFWPEISEAIEKMYVTEKRSMLKFVRV
jgi:26S proteasome regulatory subunit N2